MHAANKDGSGRGGRNGMPHSAAQPATDPAKESPAKNSQFLIITSEDAGRQALTLLRNAGIKPTVIHAKPEIGDASVELLSPEGNFDGLHRIEDYIRLVVRAR